MTNKYKLELYMWLLDHNEIDAVKDLLRMELDPEYSPKCGYLHLEDGCRSISELLQGLFLWHKSDLGLSKWISIASQIKIDMKEKEIFQFV